MRHSIQNIGMLRGYPWLKKEEAATISSRHEPLLNLKTWEIDFKKSLKYT